MTKYESIVGIRFDFLHIFSEVNADRSMDPGPTEPSKKWDLKVVQKHNIMLICSMVQVRIVT